MIEYSVDDERLRAYFQRFTPQLVANLVTHMKRFEIELVGYIKEQKLSGDPLNRRSGNLSRSINASEPSVSDALVEGAVGTNLSYGRVHELGGTVDIKSYTRSQTMAWGKPIDPISVVVRDHQATYPQRAFLVPSLQENQGAFKDEMDAAVKETIEG